MSRSDAFVNVTCDNCGEEIELLLCALAGGGWDERYCNAKLEREGWSQCKGRDLCEECAQEALDIAEMSGAVDPVDGKTHG